MIYYIILVQYLPICRMIPLILIFNTINKLISNFDILSFGVTFLRWLSAFFENE